MFEYNKEYWCIVLFKALAGHFDVPYHDHVCTARIAAPTTRP